MRTGFSSAAPHRCRKLRCRCPWTDAEPKDASGHREPSRRRSARGRPRRARLSRLPGFLPQAGRCSRAPHGAETVVGIAEGGIDLAARGAAADRDGMAPGAAARGATRAALWAARIRRRRDRVIRGVVPVRAPLVDIGRDAIETKCIWLAERDRPRARKRTPSLVGNPRRDFVAPWKCGTVDAAARGALPFSFGRKPFGAAFAGPPRAIRHRVMPAHADDRTIVPRERRIVPVAWRGMVRRVEKRAVLAACNGINRRVECVHMDVMRRALVVLPAVAAHEEAAGRDALKWHRGGARTSGRTCP